MSESLLQNRFCTTCRSVYPSEVKFCPKDGAALEAPQKIVGGRFVLKELIGAGNMGTVHRAVQLPMGREVAVKLLHAEMALNPDMVARFEREALAASTVDHPNAITIYDSGKTSDNQVFIAMEFLDGESLSSILRRDHRLFPERALELWMPAVKAMVVAHRKGVLHRDLKPDNIFVAKKVNEEGVTEEVIKVLDFGIAKLLEGHRGNRAAIKTVAGVRIGTAMYMAPEQLEGKEASKQSDVYALGLILIELVTGRMPWGRSGDEGDTMLTMLRLVNPPLPLSDLCPDQVFSPEMQRFFQDVLAIDPTKRPVDAGELLRRVAQLPEAAALTQGGAKRSEISLMMTAAALNAEFARTAEANPALAALLTTMPLPTSGDLASVPTQIKATAENNPPGEGADKGSEQTAPRHGPSEAAAAGSSGLRDLPQVPTVITANRSPAPLTGANNSGAGSSGPVRDARPPGSPIKAINQSQMATLPTGTPAPRFSGPHIEPAPTVPMRVARLPEGMNSSARHAQTLPSVGASSATMRAEGVNPRLRVTLVVVLLLGLALLVGGVYLGLRAGNQPMAKVTPLPDAATAPPPPVPVERFDAGVARSTTEPRDEPPPPTPPRPPVRTPPSVEDPPPVRHRNNLVVTFVRKRPTQLYISCGSPPRQCIDTCVVNSGEVCLARSPGYQPKRMTFEELKLRSTNRGRARVEVKLTALQ